VVVVYLVSLVIVCLMTPHG